MSFLAEDSAAVYLCSAVEWVRRHISKWSYLDLFGFVSLILVSDWSEDRTSSILFDSVC